MAIRDRVKRLERAQPALGTKYFLTVMAAHGADYLRAIHAVARKMGIAFEDVGAATVIGDDGWEDFDFHNHGGLKTLRGHKEFSDMLKKLLDDIDGTSVGPPCMREGYSGVKIKDSEEQMDASETSA